jgi:hypothetical protein
VVAFPRASIPSIRDRGCVSARIDPHRSGPWLRFHAHDPAPIRTVVAFRAAFRAIHASEICPVDSSVVSGVRPDLGRLGRPSDTERDFALMP